MCVSVCVVVSKKFQNLKRLAFGSPEVGRGLVEGRKEGVCLMSLNHAEVDVCGWLAYTDKSYTQICSPTRTHSISQHRCCTRCWRSWQTTWLTTADTRCAKGSVCVCLWYRVECHITVWGVLHDISLCSYHNMRTYSSHASKIPTIPLTSIFPLRTLIFAMCVNHTQADAGAQVVQIFDSWASHLMPQDFEVFAAPYTKKVIDSFRCVRGDTWSLFCLCFECGLCLLLFFMHY